MAKIESITFDGTETKTTRGATDRARPAWNPSEGDSSRYLTCQNDDCDNEHVDPELGRTLGDRQGRVHACPDCTSWAALKGGAAADPEFEHRVENPTELRDGMFVE